MGKQAPRSVSQTSYAVQLPYGTLRERGSKLRTAFRREGFTLRYRQSKI
ncbi:MAG TPA: hypothetical protein VE944_31105 [Nostoc sp.]|nr:hypothetical protein [Nostoc sp.]HYX18742.1 hypothetical protein [Nostoc sp.]